MKYKVILLVFVVSLLIYKIDIFFIDRRINFLIEEIENYEKLNNKFPDNLDFIADKNNHKTESSCDFFDKELAGFGYCYYQRNDSNYIIVVLGFYSNIIFEYQDGYKLLNSGKYDF